MQREEKDVDMIGQALRVAVDGVEGVRGVRRWDDPLVVRLVNVLVQPRVVLDAVNPVDAKVGEEEEEGHRQNGVRNAVVADVLVQLAVAANLAQEPRQREGIQRREGSQGALNL